MENYTNISLESGALFILKYRVRKFKKNFKNVTMLKFLFLVVQNTFTIGAFFTQDERRQKLLLFLSSVRSN